mgnify:CR=1 FL=1
MRMEQGMEMLFVLFGGLAMFLYAVSYTHLTLPTTSRV